MGLLLDCISSMRLHVQTPALCVRGAVIHACNPREVEARQSKAQGHSWQHQFKPSLGYRRSCLKTAIKGMGDGSVSEILAL